MLRHREKTAFIQWTMGMGTFERFLAQADEVECICCMTRKKITTKNKDSIAKKNILFLMNLKNSK